MDSLLAQPLSQVDNLHDFEFDVFQFLETDLPKLVIAMIQDLGFVHTLGLPLRNVCRFVLSVQKSYRRLAYHNFFHAVAVAQTAFAFIKLLDLCAMFGQQETFAFLVACLCHDVDHRGANNAFQTAARTSIGMLYQSSCLEHHHVFMTRFLLSMEEHGLQGGRNEVEYNDWIELVATMIISTDLKVFQELIAELDQQMSLEVEVSYSGMMRLLMTCCDLCAIIKPWPLSEKFARLVFAEFRGQAHLEARLEISSGSNLASTESQLPHSQVGFIDAIAMPAFSALARIERRTSFLLDRLREIRNRWVLAGTS